MPPFHRFVTVAGVKLTLSTLTCPQWTLEQIVAAADRYRLGGIDFRGVGDEIDVTRLPAFNAGLEHTLGMLHAHGLAMPCLNTSITLMSPDPARWQAMLEECHRYATLARLTKTPLLRIFGGEVPKHMTRAEAVHLARRHLKQLNKICGPDCRVALETHDHWITVENLLPLLEEFEPSQLAILWDIEHSYRSGETPEATVAGLGAFIQHIHIKDSVRVEGMNIPRLLGEGDVPFRQCVELLCQAGFDGWYSLEVEKRWRANAPEPEESIPHFAEMMRSLGE